MIIHPNYQVLYPEDPNYRCNLEVGFITFKSSTHNVINFAICGHMTMLTIIEKLNKKNIDNSDLKVWHSTKLHSLNQNRKSYTKRVFADALRRTTAEAFLSSMKSTTTTTMRNLLWAPVPTLQRQVYFIQSKNSEN